MLEIVGNNKKLSSLDLGNAYPQVPVVKSDLLIITTPKGLFRYKRLLFRLASAPGFFQKYINQLLGNLDGVCVYLGDILICASSQEEHDRRMNIVL